MGHRPCNLISLSHGNVVEDLKVKVSRMHIMYWYAKTINKDSEKEVLIIYGKIR